MEDTIASTRAHVARYASTADVRVSVGCTVSSVDENVLTGEAVHDPDRLGMSHVLDQPEQARATIDERSPRRVVSMSATLRTNESRWN